MKNLTILLKSAAVLQFLIVGIFLLTNKKGNRLANRLLAIFLLAKAFCWGEGILAEDWEYILSHPFLQVFALSTDLLLGPSLYLYAKSLMYQDYRLKLAHFLHTLPFLLYLLLLSGALLFAPPKGIDLLFSNTLPTTLIYSATYLHFITYSVLCLFDLGFYKRKLKSAYSSIDASKLSWLFLLVSGFIVIWLAAYINYLGIIFKFSAIIPWEVIIFLVFLFANIIVFRGLKQPELFSGIVNGCTDPKYAKTPLSDEKKKVVIKAITSCMQQEKPYLNPAMTLDDFSRITAIPAHHISQVLNTELRRNFFDFVNGYRIEECKSSLKDNSDRTVLQVLYESGFNSKASFHRAFKKHTGMTPSQFRNTL
ncbi:MAG TPA: helix-turn-helix domain-containing protein [bacterium]|nr:helix-turn-helix domain-containing protein [bacterium]HPN45013.1 helix-turn-helix domain-containing protein [bacterium]